MNPGKKGSGSAGKNITLKSISDALGISKTTVSLVLKGDGDRYRISRATQKRITDYTQSTGFKPDFFARGLTTRKTATIGVVFPDVHEAFMSEMVRGIESILYPAGYSMMLSTSGFSTEIELRNIRQLLYRQVDGLILVPYIPLNEPDYRQDYRSLLVKAPCPVIFVDRIPPGGENLDWIVQDDREAAFKGVNHLYKKGCRRIACLSFNLAASSLQNRIQGYREALETLGLSRDTKYLLLINRQDRDSRDLYRLFKTLAGWSAPPDGLLVTTGGLAHKAGYIMRQPETGFAEIPAVKFGKDPEIFSSGMIQIVQPHMEMGKEAARAVLARISGEKPGTIQKTLAAILIDKGEPK